MLLDHSCLNVNAKGKSCQDKVILWQKWGRNFELMTWFFQNGDPCILIVLCLWATLRERFYSDYICLLNMESTVCWNWYLSQFFTTSSYLRISSEVSYFLTLLPIFCCNNLNMKCSEWICKTNISSYQPKKKISWFKFWLNTQCSINRMQIALLSN